MPDITDPVRFHREQLAARRARAARLDGRHLWLSRGRIALVLALLALGGAAWQGWLSAWWLAVPAALFAALAVAHDRVLAALRVATRGVDWYELGLARLEDRWVGHGETGERFKDADHPYALDLDILGKGSLFQLLATARTAAGEETLARWLLGGTDAPRCSADRRPCGELAGRAPLFARTSYALGSEPCATWARFDTTGALGCHHTARTAVRFLRRSQGVGGSGLRATAAARRGLVSGGAPLLAVFNAIGGCCFEPAGRPSAAAPGRSVAASPTSSPRYARVPTRQFESESFSKLLRDWPTA